MKRSAQIFLILLLFSLSFIAFSKKTSYTKSKSFSKKSYHTSKGNGGNGGGSGTTPPVNPGADSYTACDPNNRPEVCTLEYAPVCGYINNCQGGESCTSTFGNGCGACGNANVAGYVNGACEDVQTVCDPDNRPEICTLIYTATCAVVSGGCQGSDCFINTSSPCVACATDGVAYSLPGACPVPGRTYCDANNRPEVCTEEYNPVCAHRTNNCRGRGCYVTAGNACSACGDAFVDYWTPGEC